MQYHGVFFTFSSEIVCIFTLNIPEQCQVFANKFDELQSSISKVSVSNEILAGIYLCTQDYKYMYILDYWYA